MSTSDPVQHGLDGGFGGGLDKQWYVLKGRDIIGPFSGHAIRDMVRDRRIGADAMVALPGSPDWQPMTVLTGHLDGSPAAPVLAGHYHYAGFWIRAGAYIIDSLLLSVVVFVVTFVFFFALAIIMSAAGNGNALQQWIARNNLLLNLFGALFWIGYGVVFTAGRWQATPGKRICNIHVIHESGARIGYGRAFGRPLSYYIDTLTLFIGFMLAGWTREKTALHDLICSTRVVHGRPGQTQARLAAPFE